MAVSVQPVQTKGAYDFYSPFFTAAIISEGGNRYPLTLRPETGGGTVATGLKLDGLTASGADTTTLTHLPFLSDISVELDMGQVPQINATLTPPFDLARKLIDTEAVEYMSSQLEVQFGYSAGKGDNTVLAVSPVYRGLITKPDISLGADITIAFNATGTGGYNLSTTSLSETLPKQTLQAHIQELCKRLNVEAKFQLDEGAQKLITQEETLTANNTNYMGLIYELARRCKCYVLFETLQSPSGPAKEFCTLFSMSLMIKEPSIARLRLFDGLQKIGPTTGDYPILSVSTQHEGIFLSSTTKTIIRKGMNPSTGDTERQETRPGQTPVQTTGTAGSAVGKVDQSTQVSQTADPASPSKPQALAEAEAAFQALSTQGGAMGIQLEVETLGMPDILVGQKLSVIGVSKRIDDEYIVFKVKHQLSGSGFTTSLTLVQNSQRLWDTVQGNISTLAPSPYTPSAPNPADNVSDPTPKVPVSANVQPGVP